MLSRFYGSLVPPTAAIRANLVWVDQWKYVPNATTPFTPLTLSKFELVESSQKETLALLPTHLDAADVLRTGISSGTGEDSGNELDEIHTQELHPTYAYLLRWGLVYVPTACKSKPSACKKHVHYHGCIADIWSQRVKWTDDIYINAHAEANAIVVIYPQARGDERTGRGCWNWESYMDDPLFDTRESIQLRAINNLIIHIDTAVVPSSVKQH